jgi:hypothetical protein
MRRTLIGIMHVIGVVAAHDASPSVRPVRSLLKRSARWVWPLLAASSCWACRVGRNSMLVWKKLLLDMNGVAAIGLYLTLLGGITWVVGAAWQLSLTNQAHTSPADGPQDQV